MTHVLQLIVCATVALLCHAQVITENSIIDPISKLRFNSNSLTVEGTLPADFIVKESRGVGYDFDSDNILSANGTHLNIFNLVSGQNKLIPLPFPMWNFVSEQLIRCVLAHD